jgi:RimJ/RimL family protein N-acetyltransferase
VSPVSGVFEFRSLTAEQLPLVRAWLSRPHVTAVWAPTPSEDELREHYLSHPEEPSFPRACIAYLDGEPVGFIQSYVAAYAGDGWWPDERDPGVVGIDQFLADESRLNRGLGTAMVRAFVERLFEDPTITRVQTDPSPANQRAIRCYEKAGFRRAREVQTPDGPALLMTRDRPA